MQFISVENPCPFVSLIRLNRPNALNALSIPLLVEFAAALKEAEASEDIRCVVLTGNERAFSAGADIKEMPENGIPMWGQKDRLLSWQILETFEKPLIAAVNGWALGGGFEVATICDILIAGENHPGHWVLNKEPAFDLDPVGLAELKSVQDAYRDPASTKLITEVL